MNTREVIMKLSWLGTGTINSFKNYHTNAILENKTDGTNLLIDCGGDIRFALNDIGLTYKNIDNVYISHLHGDHVGGLEWLGFCRKFDPTCHRPKLFISEVLKDDLWNHTLSGGMRSLQGEINNLDTYFDVRPIVKNGSFFFSMSEFQLVQSIHIVNQFAVEPAFGLMFNINGITTYMTTDCQFCPDQIKDFYGMADKIFHDCEILPFKSGVHANYRDLKTLPPEVKSKIWLVHFQDGERPDAIADGFLGFVERGQVFDFKKGK